MAHEIDTTTGSAAFAYVGNAAWHGLGQQLVPGASRETWLRAAGMDWDILSADVLYSTAGSLSPATFDGRKVLYRSDTMAPLSVVSDGYRLVQPAQILDFFLESAHLAGWELETAGVLREGRQFWALAKTGVGGKVNGDASVTDLYVMLATSADGSLATIGQGTAVRVVCANTMRMALKGSKGAVKVRHNTDFDARKMAAALGVVDPEATWDAFAETMQKLGETRVSSTQATAIFSEILRPGSMGERVLQDTKAETFGDLLNAPRNLRSAPGISVTDKGAGRAIRGLEALTDSYYQAPGAEPGTAYGVLQGVTHYIDHSRGKDTDRLASAWFGQGAVLKDRAMEVIEAEDWRQVA